MPPSLNNDSPRPALLRGALRRGALPRGAGLLGLVILVPLLLKLAWWARDSMLPYWDDAGYVEQAIRMFDAAGQRGLRGLAGAFLHGGGPREPLIAVQALPFLLLFGRSVAAVQLVNAFWIVIFSLALYRFCRLFWPRPVALVAVLTSAACPLLNEMGNAYLREYPLAALVVLTAYCLAVSDGLRRRRPVIMLGVLLGAGMLYRALYPLYVAGLYAAAIYADALRPRRRKAGEKHEQETMDHNGTITVFDYDYEHEHEHEHGHETKHPPINAYGRASWPALARNLALILSLGALICGPWYWVNGGGLFRHMSLATAGKIAQEYGSADVFSWPVIRDYLADAALHGVSPWGLALCVLGAAGCAVALARRRLRLNELLPGRALFYLAGWAAPFVVFLFGVNKALRFITPLLPAFAALLAVLLWGASRAFRRAGILAGAALGVSFLIVLWAQIGVGSGSPAFDRAMKHLSGGIVERRAEKNRWPYAQIIRFLHGAAPSRKAADSSVMVLSDSAHFNIDLLQLWATLERQPFQLRSSVRLRYDEAGLRTLFNHADLLIAKEGGEADLELKNPGPALVAEALGRKELEPLDCPIPLPDGGRLAAWRRSRPAPSAPRP